MIIECGVILTALEETAMLFEENGANREAHYIRSRVIEMTRRDMEGLKLVEQVVEKLSEATGCPVKELVDEWKDRPDDEQFGAILSGFVNGEVSRKEAENALENLIGGGVECKLVTAEELETLVATGELEPVTRTEPMSEEESAALEQLMDKLCARADKAAGHE